MLRGTSLSETQTEFCTMRLTPEFVVLLISLGTSTPGCRRALHYRGDPISPLKSDPHGLTSSFGTLPVSDPLYTCKFTKARISLAGQ
jgi:hypothetical protein